MSPDPSQHRNHEPYASAIARRLTAVTARITEAAQNCGRDPGSVSLIAVSKTFPAASVAQAAAAGHREFGENYAQEAVDKILETSANSQFTGPKNLCWHFIGPVQSNKTRLIAEHFDWVHSVSNAKSIRRLAGQRPDHLPPLNVCIQVNVSGEGQKSGVSAADAESLCRLVGEFSQLRLRGLMAIPAPVNQRSDPKAPFMQLAALRDQLDQRGVQLDTLSMGMSDDFEAAIACGATHVRIGSAIFGSR